MTALLERAFREGPGAVVHVTAPGGIELLLDLGGMRDKRRDLGGMLHAEDDAENVLRRVKTRGKQGTQGPELAGSLYFNCSLRSGILDGDLS